MSEAMVLGPQPLLRVPRKEDLVPMQEERVSKLQAVRDRIRATVTPETATFDNVLRCWSQQLNEVTHTRGMASVLAHAPPDEETKIEIGKLKRVWRDAEERWMLEDWFFRLVEAVAARNEDLEKEDQHLLAQYTRREYGKLTKEGFEKYVREEREIDSLVEKFMENINEDTEEDGVWFSVDDLQGVPASHQQRWKAGEGSKAGKKFVPFSTGVRGIILFAKSETRKLFWLGRLESVPQKEDLFHEIVRRRDHQARVLGYDNHATYVIERQAAKSVKWVEEFLAKVRDGILPVSGALLHHLKQLRKADLKEREGITVSDDKLPPWDMMHYYRLAHQDISGAAIDDRITEYFPIEYTAPAMLDIFATVLGLRFTPIPKDQLKDKNVLWDDSVDVWSVWDENEKEVDGGFLGYLYFDLLFRKRKDMVAKNVTFQRGYLRPDGGRAYPSTVLLCSYQPSSEEKCTLLSHSEVKTLFHELGHGIHNLLSKTKYSLYHGSNNVPSDFVEMPSIMLESWCWVRSVLHKLGRHYSRLSPKQEAIWKTANPNAETPPERFPDDLLDKLIESQKLNLAMWVPSQLTVSTFDMKLYTPKTHDDAVRLNPTELWYDLREEIEGLDMSECRRAKGDEHARSPHVIKPHDASYYGYVTSSVWAKDLFDTVFAKDPYDKAAWDRYRRVILEPGSSTGDDLGMLAELLGRPPNSDAINEDFKNGLDLR